MFTLPLNGASKSPPLNPKRSLHRLSQHNKGELKTMNSRIEKLVNALNDENIDALLVTNEVNVRYLTGFTGDSTYLVVGGDSAILLSDGRYESQIATQCPDFEARIRSPSDLLPDLTRETLRGIQGRENSLPSVGLESQHLSLSSYRNLTSEMDGVNFVETVGIVENLRMIKDLDEIAITKKAVKIAQDAFLEVLPQVRGNWTELQLAYALESSMRGLGAEGCSFAPIVAAGPGAALPHYQPTNRTLDGADCLLIDWGALCDGYASDLTRTIPLSGGNEAFSRSHAVVLEAQMAAIEAIAPGRPTREVDEAARKVLRREGMEDAFKHGLGHGIGLQIHESPRMSAVGENTLQSGMIITVEPGVYFDGEFGIRIEDDVLVTETGHEVLSDLPKGLDDHQLIL